MQRLAVFVDAGYLFAQGSTALTGSKVARVNLSLSARSVIEELKSFAAVKAPDFSLLRIYWYDGIRAGSAMSSDQTAIADLDDIKLRLGFINGQGQQKGVDSLIVTDLIELARQKAIGEAVLLSGDEDVRIGVQIAQNYGVRVHLLGIHPARGSQSPTLRQEADTTFEWDKETVAKFMTVREVEQPVAAVIEVPAEARDGSSPVELEADPYDRILGEVAQIFVGTLKEADLVAVEIFWKENRGVPPEFDGKMLARAGERLGRRLTKEEMRQVRSDFRRCFEQRRSAST